jgi:hypothetical protein
LRVVARLAVQDLDRDLGLQAQVYGLVDLTEAAAAEQAYDFVLSAQARPTS